MKAVFDTRATSICDNEVTQQYHFPKRYVGRIEECVSDWIVLRRTRAAGESFAYFATARVGRIEPDPQNASMNYAKFDDYVPFDNPVPWTIDGRHSEEALRSIQHDHLGPYLKDQSIRHINDSDFAGIIAVGLQSTLAASSGQRLSLLASAAEATNFLNASPPGERIRRIEQVLANRLVRDTSFRRQVCNAYDHRCAFTGLKIVAGSAYTEAEAAHIWPVAQGGPDAVQNGLALTRTVHWLFDRHLISITDDHRILIKRQAIPDPIHTLLLTEGRRLHLPANKVHWPHPFYLAKHRAQFNGVAVR